MIVSAAAMIADDTAHSLRRSIQIAQHFHQRFSCEFGGFIHSAIQISNVSLVMFGVMDLHRARINMWFERVVCICQLWKFKCHVYLSFVS